MTESESTPAPSIVDDVTPSTLHGTLTQQFVEQFRDIHAGTPVRLLVSLHPALHHQHLADTVAEICAVRGVADVAWINRPGVTFGVTGPVRAVLAGYQVRPLNAVDRAVDAPRPLVVAFHPPTGTALMTGHLTDDDDNPRTDQRGLTLADMVDQVLGHHAEISDLPEPYLPAWEPYVRCDACRRMAPSDPGEVGAGYAGAQCVALRLTADGGVAECGGTLRPVQAVVTDGHALVAGPVAGDGGQPA